MARRKRERDRQRERERERGKGIRIKNRCFFAYLERMLNISFFWD